MKTFLIIITAQNFAMGPIPEGMTCAEAQAQVQASDTRLVACATEETAWQMFAEYGGREA